MRITFSFADPAKVEASTAINAPTAKVPEAGASEPSLRRITAVHVVEVAGNTKLSNHGSDQEVQNGQHVGFATARDYWFFLREMMRRKPHENAGSKSACSPNQRILLTNNRVGFR